MTNFEIWQQYFRNCTAPQNWIDFGFYYLIGSALQRRVWFYGSGDDGSELFPNSYIVFVGRPGLGKGLVTRPLAKLLRYHKHETSKLLKTNIGDERPPVFPLGADSQTFEQLLDDIAESIRYVPRPGKTPYIHSSYNFILEELDSLFKRKTHDVAAFLKNAYDCGSYEYKTRHQAKHLLRKLCLSLIAGTQPDFFFTAQKTGLFGEGFASRTLFIFENEKRFSLFHNTGLDTEQHAAETTILAWIKKLSLVYGPLTYSEETASYLEDWERTVHTPRELTAHPRMQEYLSRKKVMMLKLAIAMHFGEEISFTIQLPTFQSAIAKLDAIEPSMEKGLGIIGNNPAYIYHTRIAAYIRSKDHVSERELIINFIQDLPPEEIKSILNHLTETTKEVKCRAEKGQKVYYA